MADLKRFISARCVITQETPQIPRKQSCEEHGVERELKCVFLSCENRSLQMWPLCGEGWEKGSLFSLYLVASQISLWLSRLALCLGMNLGARDGSPFHLILPSTIPSWNQGWAKPRLKWKTIEIKCIKSYIIEGLPAVFFTPNVFFGEPPQGNVHILLHKWGHEVLYPDHAKISF